MVGLVVVSVDVVSVVVVVVVADGSLEGAGVTVGSAVGAVGSVDIVVESPGVGDVVVGLLGVGLVVVEGLVGEPGEVVWATAALDRPKAAIVIRAVIRMEFLSGTDPSCGSVRKRAAYPSDARLAA